MRYICRKFHTETGTASQSICHGDVLHLLPRRPIPVPPHVFFSTAIYTEDEGNRLFRNFGAYLPQHLSNPENCNPRSV